MKQSINEYQFTQAFQDMNRSNNFSYAGLKALFDYLEEYEDSTGEEVGLDVIALCCDYTEYENVEEFISNYDDSYVVYEDEETKEINYQDTLEKIAEYTQVIDIDGESFIISCF